MIIPSVSKDEIDVSFSIAQKIEAGTKSSSLIFSYQGPILSLTESLSGNPNLIKELNKWDFNILDIKDVTEKHQHVFAMFKSCFFIQSLDVDEKIFSNFLAILQEKYNHRNNPFHNFDHGITGRKFL